MPARESSPATLRIRVVDAEAKVQFRLVVRIALKPHIPRKPTAAPRFSEVAANSEIIMDAPIHRNIEGKYKSLSVDVVFVLTGKLTATTREQRKINPIDLNGTRLILRRWRDLI
jgi:hypothetical protein